MGAVSHRVWREAQTRQGQYQIATADSEKSDAKSIQSVDRALSILEALSLRDAPLMLNEIAKVAEINLSTCHHLVKTLVKRGYVVYGGRSGGYSLSSRLETISRQSSRDYNLAEFVRANLQELNVNLREAVQMAVLRGLHWSRTSSCLRISRLSWISGSTPNFIRSTRRLPARLSSPGSLRQNLLELSLTMV